MKIIGYHIYGGKIAESTGRIILSDYIESLLAPIDGIRVVYNLNWFAAQLFKLINITEQEAHKLHDITKSYVVGGYFIQYVPEKFLAIKDFPTGRAAFFSDISQYNEDKTIHYDNDSPQLEARLSQEIGEDVYKAFIELGLHPSNLISPVKIWHKEKMRGNLPTWMDCPEEANWYAYNCCHGGWVEAYKKGHFEQTWDYDIVSAYASKLMNLYDTRHGTWVNSADYQDKAFYGFCLCDVEITAPFSPILFSKSNQDQAIDQTYTPVGIWPNPVYITKHQIDFIRDYKIGVVHKIHSGHWWLPDYVNRKVWRPLEKIIEGLYEQKQTATGRKRDIAKRIMNGLWGYTGQIMEEQFGDYFNPVWYAVVENKIRLEVAKFVLDNKLYPDNLLSVIVDGVLTSKPVNLAGTGKIGEWKLSSNCPAFVVYSGLQAIRDKAVISEFSANYEWLMQSIKDRPQLTGYTQTRKSVYTLAKCIQQKCLDKLGDIYELTKTIDVSHEAKRGYIELPQNGGDLLNKTYDSLPLDISIVMGDIDELPDTPDIDIS